MAFNPTEQQNEAITTKTPLLVCAAAGSGKTAVLAERAARALSDKKNPIKADRLLVVTFTNTAAAEMRDRIERNMEERCNEERENKFLLKQKLLLQSAKICTIDSFCIDFVRENAQAVGVQPDFRLLDSFALEELLSTAATNVLNRYYLEDNGDFSSLLDYVGSDYGDANLVEAVRAIYDFTRNIPFSNDWLKKAVELYDTPDFYCKQALDEVKTVLNREYVFINDTINKLTDIPELAEKYSPVLCSMADQIGNIIEKCELYDWDSSYSLLSGYSAKNLTANKNPELSGVADAVKYLKSGVKKSVDKCAKMVYNTRAVINEELKTSGAHIKKLVEICMDFEAEVERLMREKNAYTFYNTERMALELLVEKNGEDIIPTEAAKEFSQRFDEVMVDEYQDVNDLQDMLFTVLSNGGKKLFAVGDAKQSIYGFRGSNPRNFINKQESKDYSVVSMSGNFRSRCDVCEFTNFIFGKLYKGYKGDELLQPLATFPENNVAGCEIHFAGKETSSLEGEAAYVADYIADTVNQAAFIRDGEFLRKANYKDIAILLPTVKGKAQVFVKALQDRGIPVSVANGDFVSSPEILTAVSLLSIINNPTNDTALLSVLMSPIGAFSADEVAKMRIGRKDISVYASLMLNAQKDDKSCKFLNLLNRLRASSLTMPIASFVAHALDVSSLYELVCVYGDSAVRRANLSALCDIAVSYEKNTEGTLSSFLDYIERMRQTGFDSPVVIAGDNSVKIMSLHASKGLQFPVCILGCVAEKFNNPAARNSVNVDEYLGISLRFTDEEKREKSTSLAKLVMSSAETRRLIEEKKRLLYVGMTRAEERLVICINKDFSDKSLNDSAAVIYLSDKQTLDEAGFSEVVASSFADMIIPAAMLHPDADALREMGGLSGYEGLDSNSRLWIVDKRDSIPEIKRVDRTDVSYDISYSPELASQIMEAVEYVYPYDELKSVEAKTSVSALVHKGDNSHYFSSRPAFMSKFGLTPAQRGTAMHKFMEKADYALAASDIEEHIEYLREYGFLSYAEAESLDRDKLRTFFLGELYKRIAASDSVKHEMRFLTEINAAEVNPEISDRFKDEKIMVQGAVDLVFEEADGLVIVDFKTDKAKTERELKETYSKQLEFYSAACLKTLKKNVKEVVIYSFELNKAITI